MEETAENLPQDYHVLDSVEALQYLVDHPGGVGFGLVGPRIGMFFPSPSDVAFHIEGSIFQIAFELGVVGLTFWLIFLAVCTWFGWKAWMAISSTEMQAVAAVAIAGGIGSLVVFLFIPLMQSLTMMAWMWFFLGLTLAAVETEGYWMRLQAGAVPSDRELP
jgi:O-antigen ligase